MTDAHKALVAKYVEIVGYQPPLGDWLTPGRISTRDGGEAHWYAEMMDMPTIAALFPVDGD